RRTANNKYERADNEQFLAHFTLLSSATSPTGKLAPKLYELERSGKETGCDFPRSASAAGTPQSSLLRALGVRRPCPVHVDLVREVCMNLSSQSCSSCIQSPR